MPERILLRPGRVTFADLRRAGREGVKLEFPATARRRLAAGERALARRLAEGRRTYGVNTGFGSLADRTISAGDQAELQRRMVLSTAAGTGPLLADGSVRRILFLKIAGLALGLSGVRESLVDALVALYNNDILPHVPAKGSVGASGDLAPLAHLGAGLIGEGEARLRGETMPAVEALRRAKLKPFALGPKEGLALVNGTQASTVLAAEGLFLAEALMAAAVVAGALTVEAALGQTMPFDARIHAARGQPGQIAAAGAYRRLLAGSGLRRLAARTGRVQDPYSLRCQPQVTGACLDQLAHAAAVVARELNAATDNPLVFARDRDVLYGGNFHAEPIGLASDGAALALAELGSMSERRVALLVDASMSRLPAFLAAEPGLDSGFMAAQIAAAALASENKVLVHPATADSIPTAANQEDFVSMATFAARRLGEIADNVAGIVAIELLAACQGLETRRPARPGRLLRSAYESVRERVAAMERDRLLAPDIAAVKTLVLEGGFLEFVPADLRFCM